MTCGHSSFAIIMKRKEEAGCIAILSNRCIVTINVLWLFLAVRWVDLHCVIVVLPDQTHFLTVKVEPTIW